MRDKRLIALAILGVMALASLIYGILTPSKLKQGLSSSAVSVVKPNGGNSLLPKERHAPRSSYESWGRNPFILQEGVSDKMLVLNGIAWDKKAPQVIINNRILNAGDKIRGSTVVAIQPHSVTLNDGSQNFELKLGRKR